MIDVYSDPVASGQLSGKNDFKFIFLILNNSNSIRKK